MLCFCMNENQHCITLKRGGGALYTHIQKKKIHTRDVHSKIFHILKVGFCVKIILNVLNDFYFWQEPGVEKFFEAPAPLLFNKLWLRLRKCSGNFTFQFEILICNICYKKEEIQIYFKSQLSHLFILKRRIELNKSSFTSSSIKFKIKNLMSPHFYYYYY